MPKYKNERSSRASSLLNRALSRRRFLQGASASVLGLAVGGSFSLATAQSTRDLVIAGILQTSDPHRQTGSISIQPAFCEPPVGQDLNGELQPFLLESWQVKDPQTYRFEVRPGIRFHNGRELTAEDIKLNLERVANLPGAWLYDLAQQVAQIDLLDSHTLRVNLAEPYAPFLPLLSELWIAAPESPGWDDTITTPIGTGPFEWSRWAPAVELWLARHPNYWQDGLPGAGALSFREIQGDNSIALRAGDVHIASISVTQAAALQRVPNIDILTSKATSWSFVSFQNNDPRPPFNDIRVRRAIIHSLDKQGIAQVAAGQYGVVANQMAAPGTFYHNPDLPDPYATPDLDAAQRLLAEAGVDPREHTITMPVNSNNATTPLVVAAQIEQLGFSVDLQLADNVATEIRLRERNWDLYFAGSGPRADIALRFVRMLSDGPNPGLWGNVRDPEYDRLVRQAFVTIDDETRRDLYWQAWNVVTENLYTTVIYHSSGLTGVRDEVSGFTTGTTPNLHRVDSGIAYAELMG